MTGPVGPAAWDDPDVRALTSAQQAELRARYDGDTEPGTPPTLRLETGPRQPEAIGLCESAGYRPVAAFGAYVDEPDAGCSLYYERELDRG